VPDLTPDLGSYNRYMQADLQQVLAEAGLAVIDSKTLFCGTRPACSPLEGAEMLMLDESHMAPAGAAAFGAALLAIRPIQ